MNNYLTTFSNIAAYNQFLDSNDCPPVNVSYITSTSEVKYYKDTPEAIPFTVEIDTLPSGVSEVYPKFYMETYDPNYPNGDKIIWLKYKINNGSWVEYPETWNNNPDGSQLHAVNITTTLAEGDKISFISNNLRYNFYFNSDYWFLEQNTDGLRVNISGNIMSLVYGDDYLYATPDYYEGSKLYFNNMFSGSTFLKDASDLVLPKHNLPDPITENNQGIFEEMFSGCTNLVSGPNILAKELPFKACKRMYLGCTNLTDIGTISAKTVHGRAFDWMYFECTSITGVNFNTFMPNVEKVTGEWVFAAMFRNCTGIQSITGIGDLVSNVSIANNSNYVFGEMFFGCTSLDITDDSEVFDISTSINNMDLFYYMFANCTSLTHTPVMNYVSATSSMFQDCYSITHLYWLGTNWIDYKLGDNWSAAEGTLYYNGTETLEYDPSSVVPGGWSTSAYTPSN